METKNVPKKRVKRAKVIGLKALAAKKYDFLKDLPDWVKASFGDLVSSFIMVIWARSASGKSNFVYEFLAVMLSYFNVLYVALEEGTEATTQIVALRHLNEEKHAGKILFADHEMTYDELVWKLKKKKSPQCIVIDSIQYWDCNYEKYKALKAMFPKKAFIFISHAKGKNPDGHTADKIRYDAGIKVFVEGFIAFPQSRYGGNKPHVVFEPGAKKYWKKKYKSITS